ncbi:NADH dehydrogenase (ubiquinone) complex I, assembly factor 6 [Coelomomyces lativittatus]|nr:NADH dehydrogenase (ubiquinone) complex I, assembly factor 6 [Coelomomyces lativittatus]
MGLYRISLSMKFRFKRGSSLSRMLPWMNSSQTSVAQFSSLPPPPVHAFKYCRDLVYKKDYEGYLASLCLPSSLQPISWGLRSFNIELATIRDVVHQDALGSMRFQFWRDQVMTLSKNQTMHHHPVMELLSYHLREVTISIPRLKKMISARVLFINKLFYNLNLVPSFSDFHHF